MKEKTLESGRRNIFGIIKESVFGSFANFFRTLASTEPDDIEDEVETAESKAEVAKMERTTFDSDDVVEVEAGKTVNFGGLKSYRRDVDVKEVLEARKDKEEKNRLQEKEGSSRTREAR